MLRNFGYCLMITGLTIVGVMLATKFLPLWLIIALGISIPVLLTPVEMFKTPWRANFKK